MKYIALFTSGAGVIDTDNSNQVKIGGEEPLELIDYNNENMIQYFGIGIEEEKLNTKVSIR